jgi:hypothetical protein
MAVLPRARPGRSERRQPLGASRARPDSAGLKATVPPPLSEASLSTRHPDSRCSSAGSPLLLPPRQRQSEAVTIVSPSTLHAADVPRCLLLHATFRHATAPTSFHHPSPFRSPCRTPPAAALLRRLHPELGSAAFPAPVRSPSCSLPAPLTRATVRATLLSPPCNVTPPRHRARAGAWALRSSRLKRWATCMGRAQQDRGPRALCKPGRANTVQTGHVGTMAVGCALVCHWATVDSARWPLNYFSIFQIYSNPYKFKNLCRIHLNLENYETNFVG